MEDENMSSLTIRLPDDKHQRLKALAASRHISINKLIDEFDEQTQNHITKVMATDYEIENIDKAVDDILLKYERERLESQKKDILKKLENEQDGETKKELSKELSNIIIALAKIK